jgi:hypothetical protein
VDVVSRPTCQFAVPAQLAFGVVTSPQSRDLEVIFENVGTEVSEVSHVEVSPETPVQPAPLYSVVNAPTTTQSIAPGGLLHVTVRAWPQGPVPALPTTVQAFLRLTINSPDVYASVALSADLELSCLSAVPSPVDFGTVQTGCRSADRPVTLRNECSHPVVVTSATLAGFSSFAVTSALPQTLAPNASVLLTARYTPVAVGPERATLDVSWLDGSAGKHSVVPLKGEANATGLNTDTFSARGNKLDLLLALDDSCSMMDKTARVNAQLPALFTSLQAHGVDFQLGVVTAADGGNGVLRRTSTGAAWLTPTTPNLPARLGELTVWTGQYDLEDCEGPFLRALTAPEVVDPQLNGGFLRTDAALSLLCVTDVNQTADRLEQLRQVKGAEGVVTWDAIAPVDNGNPACFVAWLPPAAGALTPAQVTGGSDIDICSSTWSPLFETIATRAATLRTFFPLRVRPDPFGTPPLAVSISGVPVGPTASNGATVWTWASAQNAVVFTAQYAPATSDVVTVTYPVACSP